jgi:hypothetical protein
VGDGDHPAEIARQDGRRLNRDSAREHISMSQCDQRGSWSAMTLQPGDRVRLKPKHAAVRSASARARSGWLIRIGVVHKIRRHSPWAYVVWGDNRHADQEQICVLEKME